MISRPLILKHQMPQHFDDIKLVPDEDTTTQRQYWLDYSLSKYSVLQAKYGQPVADRFQTWFANLSLPLVKEASEFRRMAESYFTDWWADCKFERNLTTLQRHALDRLEESVSPIVPTPESKMSQGKAVTRPEVIQLDDLRNGMQPDEGFNYRVEDCGDGSLNVTIENKTVIRIDETFLDTLKRLYPWTWRDGKPIKLVKRFHKNGKMTFPEPLVMHVLALKYGQISDWNTRRATKFINGNKWDWRQCNVELSWAEDTKNRRKENRDFHPHPTDRNDKHQDMMLDIVERGSTIPEAAGLGTREIVGSKKIFAGPKGKVYANPDPAELASTLNPEGKPSGIPVNPDNIDYDAPPRPAPVLKTASTVEPLVKRRTRRERVFCPECKTLRRVVLTKDNALGLECLHERPLDLSPVKST